MNAGWQRDDGTAATPTAGLLNELADETPHVWENVRYDVYTLHAVLEHLGEHSVCVLYVAFGETDDWAHEGRYDLYLDAAWRTDRYIRRLWDAIQSRSEYRGRTSLLLTTDHGRGDTREDWKNHGHDVPGADRIWMAVMGPHVPAAGFVSGVATTQGQVAATVAALVGEDFHAATPQVAPVLPGVVATAR